MILSTLVLSVKKIPGLWGHAVVGLYLFFFPCQHCVGGDRKKKGARERERENMLLLMRRRVHPKIFVLISQLLAALKNGRSLSLSQKSFFIRRFLLQSTVRIF
jgi:hypothetical protein